MHKKMSQSMHMGLCRIKPQTHLYVMKAHCLLQVDRLDVSLSPLRTEEKWQLYLAQGIAICMH